MNSKQKKSIIFLLTIVLSPCFSAFCENDIKVINTEALEKEISTSYVGLIEDDNSTSVYCRTSGEIESILTKNGAFVEKESVIAKIKDEYQSRALNSAIAALKESKQKFETHEKLSKNGLHSRIEFLESKTRLRNAQYNYQRAKLEYDALTIKAPISGIVFNKKLYPSDIIRKDDFLLKIISKESFKVSFSVSHSEVIKFNIGQKAQVKTPNGQTYDANISKVSADAAKDTKNYEIQALVKLEDSSQFPILGLFSLCSIEVSLGKKFVYEVPSSALKLKNNSAPAILIIDDENKARLAEINIESDKKDYLYVTLKNDQDLNLKNNQTIKLITLQGKRIKHGEKVNWSTDPSKAQHEIDDPENQDYSENIDNEDVDNEDVDSGYDEEKSKFERNPSLTEKQIDNLMAATVEGNFEIPNAPIDSYTSNEIEEEEITKSSN